MTQFFKREFMTTNDGSKTLYIPAWDEPYHSKHGAIQEAYHVFIKNGLDLFRNREISILEIGFGTGLNALITLLEAPTRNLKIHYAGIENYPVLLSEVIELAYCKHFAQQNCSQMMEQLHTTEWEKRVDIHADFSLLKRKLLFENLSYHNTFDLIYFDAFGARVQPELWTETIFKLMFEALTNQGVLVTYAAKGSVRRAMTSIGFKVERLPGPPGKREMLRGVKIL